ncbi:MAG: UDP-N-acetylmuramate dehydrogenase [Muribaculum sp.]|nr:UDP-N-acetylmuramate dehydrogenase [Muribaculaceae bacterium]MCM1080613.1 UDP-N-acetylmuramate dehydrogenase [Muribaculum sp.]
MYKVKHNVDLSPYTTFGISADADTFVEYSSIESLIELLTEFDKCPLLCLGQGSNMFFTCDFHGAVLHSRIEGICLIGESETEVKVKVGSGVVWDDFVAWCVENSYYGAENLSAIPGTVGASCVQNIGAYGVEAKDLIAEVEAVDVVTRSVCVFSAEECKFGYRDSVFKHTDPEMRYVVTGVTYKLKKNADFNLEYGALLQLRRNPVLSLQDVRSFITQLRNAKLPDPSEIGSAGSFFKNPVVNEEIFKELRTVYPQMPHYSVAEKGKVKLSAGWLIEQSGLKGVSIGGAQVWPKQCLVIANTGGATSDNVMELMHLIQQTIMAKFNVELTPEVLLVGSSEIIKG